MKIRFDFYTADLAYATKAFEIACGSTENVSLRRNEYGRRCYNIDGEIDHRKMEPLFSFFEDNDFSEHND